MRGTWLRTAGVLALLSAAVTPARADVVVIDPSEITQVVNELNELKQMYQVAQNTLGTLLRVVNPNGIAQNIIGMQPMPSTQNITGILTGGNNFGALSTLANQFQSTNTYYTPQSTGTGDYSASMLSRNSNSLAGLQAMLATQMQSTQTYISGLTQIQSSLNSVTSEADLTAIQGRIAAETANMQAQGVQITAINGMMSAQQQQYQLMGDQRRRQAADCLLASVNGGGTCTSNTTAAATATQPDPATGSVQASTSLLNVGNGQINANGLSLN